MNASTGNTKKDFFALSELLGREIRKMKQTCASLFAENERLREELSKLRNQSELFSGLNDNQKMILKQQISEIITKLDTHLEHGEDEVN